MMRPKCLLMSFFVLAIAAVAVAQDPKTQPTVDPSGTWKWDVQFGDNTIDHTLRINADEGKVTGTYQTIFENAPENAPPELSAPIKIDEGKLDGDKISYSVTRSFGGNEFTIEYSGVVAGDEIAGTSKMDFGGEPREFEWSTQRVVRTEDVVGKWKVKFETPRGEIEETLSLVKGDDGEKLTGTFHSSFFGDSPIKDIKVNDKKLSFVIELENDNFKMTAMYDVTPRGDKLDGTIFVAFGDQESKTPVTGVRVNSPKAAEAQPDDEPAASDETTASDETKAASDR